jgi:hypothetical protein
MNPMSEYPPGSFVFAECIMDMHVEEARHEVQAQRLRRQVGAVRPRSQRFHRAVLAGLGQHLVAWGASLQESYSTEESTPTPARAG